MKKFQEFNSENTLNCDYKTCIIGKLKNALKEEFNAWYGYIIVKEWLTGLSRVDIEKMYDETAKDELEDHAFWLMKRINELGGTIEDISASPASWLTADHTYISPVWSWKTNNTCCNTGVVTTDLPTISLDEPYECGCDPCCGDDCQCGGCQCKPDIIEVKQSLLTNIKNEEGAIETYRDLIRIAQSGSDFVTERKCKEILADEEEHLQMLKDFLADIG